MKLSRHALVSLGTAVVLTVVVLGPVLFRPGYVLVGDMVFVPDPPWKSSYLGLDGSIPRAVPTDALVWLLTTVLPGSLVQKGLLALAVALAVVGVQRLLADTPALARVAASVAYVWTPYTFDRLAIGQWSLLVSAAFLPWVVLAARSSPRTLRGSAPLLLAVTGAALFSPSGGLVAAAVALAVVVGTRERLAALGIGVVANLPWLVPGLFADAETPTSRAAVEAFAARAESSLGLVPSLLGSGGIWKASIVAPERGSALIVLLALAITIAGLAGASRVRSREIVGLAVVGTLGLALCVLTATWPGVLSNAMDVTGGLGILRDSTRYLVPFTLLVALGLGHAVAWLLERRASWGGILAVVLVSWPPLVLPSLAWGELGDLSPVAYPDEWYAVRAQLAAEPLDGPLVVLPWEGFYRRFEWNDDRAGLDPAPRFFPGEVVIDDRVFLGDVVLPNEQKQSALVTQLLGPTGPPSGSLLADEGFGGVLAEDDGLDLRRLNPRTHEDAVRISGRERAIILVSDVFLTLLVVMSILLARPTYRYARPTREREPE